YSTTNDDLEPRGALAPFFGDGIIGQAVHVGHTDYADNWCWLETALGADSPDLELNSAFTVEMYLDPQIDKTITNSDQLMWQDLIGKWFVDPPNIQNNIYQSYEFVLNYGYPLMNVSDISDRSNLPRAVDSIKSDIRLDPYNFSAINGWQHLAFVGDGTGRITIYIDGVAHGSGKLPNTEFVNTHAPLR
ncbi:MAG: LamG domain-containing protein, partial [Planctomycetes bacterium]|nr:LamG domain-containing protein [Planctomycetota bacterium]